MLIATVTTQRSGSKLLAACFAAGAQVRPYGEIFNPDAWNVVSYRAFLATFAAETAAATPDKTLDHYFSAFEHLHGISHFDLMYNQLEIPCTAWNPYDSYFIYGYLRSRGALVISLERSHKDVFISRKYLEHSKRPHFNSEELVGAPAARGLRLDLDEYRQFKQYVEAHRRELYEAMASYPYFIRVDYAQLAERGVVPRDLCELIAECAKARKISLNPTLIQLHNARLRRTGVDYGSVFENFSELI